ncbi:MAG: polysaccharide biosynthesis C-terminal domain-containing protein, partial [Candidatus Magasanikbacteria bacterium]|nr:polysaccharide biosynthesis C-terminal domain-containing protein [Candidatus Magasanikbacteria bacterium]
IFSDFGFIITTANMLSEPRFDQKKLLDTLFTWRLITAAVFQGGAPLLFLLFPYPIEIKIAVIIISVSFFAIGVSNVFTGYYQQQLKTYINTIGELIGRFVLLGGVLMLARLDAKFLPMMALISAASILNAIYLYYKMPSVHISFDKEISRALFIKIWPTALCVIFNSFYLQGDRVILPLYTSTREVAFYGASYRVLDIIIQMSALIMGIMAPLLAYSWSRSNIDEFKHRLQMSFDLVAIFLIPTMLGAVALSSKIMSFVGGADFASAGKILSYLSLAIFGICFGMVFGYTALAINKQKQAVWVYLADAILSVIGYFIFIPRFGIYGAAGVTIFSEFFAGVCLLIIVCYHARFVPRLTALAKISLSSIIMYLTITHFQTPHVLISIVLGGIIYILLILILRVVSRDTIREIIPRQLSKIGFFDNI